MQKIQIETSLRSSTGKGFAKKTRREGSVPGIVYGKGINLPITVPTVALKALKASRFSKSTIVDMKITGSNETDTHALIKGVQYNPTNDDVIHLDFMKVSLQDKIRVHVPLSLKGESKGVKDGGVLEQILYTLEVEGLPLEIPEKIEVDITDLVVGRSIHVGAIKVADNVKIITSAEDTAVTRFMHVEEAVEAPAAADGAPTEPEVIKEKKEVPGEEGAADKKPAAEKKAPEKAAKPEKK